MKPSASIAWEFVPVHAIIDEVKPLVHRHYEEMTDGDDYGPPDLNWDEWREAGEAGQIWAVAARHQGKLVGYAVYTVAYNPRYQNMVEANCDALFMERQYRARHGVELLRKADEFLTRYGVNETNYTLSDPRIGKLLERMGYQQTYKIWSNRHGK